MLFTCNSRRIDALEAAIIIIIISYRKPTQDKTGKLFCKVTLMYQEKILTLRTRWLSEINPAALVWSFGHPMHWQSESSRCVLEFQDFGSAENIISRWQAYFLLIYVKRYPPPPLGIMRYVRLMYNYYHCLSKSLCWWEKFRRISNSFY